METEDGGKLSVLSIWTYLFAEVPLLLFKMKMLVGFFFLKFLELLKIVLEKLPIPHSGLFVWSLKKPQCLQHHKFNKWILRDVSTKTEKEGKQKNGTWKLY